MAMPTYDNILTAEAKKRAWALHKSGVPIITIAKRLGYTVSSVRDYLKQARIANGLTDDLTQKPSSFAWSMEKELAFKFLADSNRACTPKHLR